MNPPAGFTDNLPRAAHELGSPAPNVPDGQRSTAEFNAFSAMVSVAGCGTPETPAIAMTYSARACTVGAQPRMDFWASPIKQIGRDERNLRAACAHLDTYRPSAGLPRDLHLSYAPFGTMVAVYAPPSNVEKMVFCTSPRHKVLLDLRLTIRAWLEECGAFPAVTCCAWTGELDKDLAPV